MTDITLKNQRALNFFRESLTNRLDKIYKDQSIQDFPKEMFTTVYKESILFFDKQMHNDSPQFVALLLSAHPELLTTYMDREEIPMEDECHISMYDHLCVLFFNMLINDAMMQGVEAGVYTLEEGSINLTPKFEKA